MVRIAHISDSHLGSSLFELVERREDVRKCFKKALDMAMRHSPDILVHTGDLFDTPYPHTDDLSMAMECLKEIRDEVPVFILQGNHDLPYGYRRSLSPLRVLETAGLIRSTGDGPYKEFSETLDGQGGLRSRLC